MASGALQPWRIISQRYSSSMSGAVDSILLRGLKEHYLEVSKMTLPPKIDPPSPFSIVKGALDNNGPVLKRIYGEEEINISVMRLANIVPDGQGAEDDDLDQLLIHVDVSKSGQNESLHFVCCLYSDAVGIHSVAMRPELDLSQLLVPSSKYSGPAYEDLDPKMRNAFHNYIDERGVSESLFTFLQTWLYVKEHRKVMKWFTLVAAFIKTQKAVQED